MPDGSSYIRDISDGNICCNPIFLPTLTRMGFGSGLESPKTWDWLMVMDIQGSRKLSVLGTGVERDLHRQFVRRIDWSQTTAGLSVGVRAVEWDFLIIKRYTIICRSVFSWGTLCVHTSSSLPHQRCRLGCFLRQLLCQGLNWPVGLYIACAFRGSCGGWRAGRFSKPINLEGCAGTGT